MMASQPAGSRRTVLVIEDEPGIVDTLVYALGTEGFVTVSAPTGRDGLQRLAAGGVSLVVLDIGLPDMNGFDVLRDIRSRSEVPVLCLTARADEIDRVVGLELGADDYVVKPFSPREVVARVRAILRRMGASPVAGPAQTSAFVVDEGRRAITYFGERLQLPRYEYEILRLLVGRPGWVFTREQIMAHVWTDPAESYDRAVDAHVKSIRARLREIRPDVDPIVTHRGIGYAVREDLCR